MSKAKRPLDPRFRRLRLLTATDLARLEDFYCGRLQIARTHHSQSELTLEVGATRLTFAKAPKAGEGPLYHFAFNIPQNQIRGALDWARERVDLIPAWGDLRDPNYDREIIHFRHWNAHSLFFWDPAFNLVEFIARHDLAHVASGRFSEKNLLCVSEIGLPTSDPVWLANHLHSTLRLPAYPAGTSPAFAMGDENGLLLCLQQGQLWRGDPRHSRHWGAYEAEVEIKGALTKLVEAPGYPYRIRVVA